MKQKLIMTKGLPASGKSTWAKEQEGFKRVNMDDIRNMVDNGEYSKSNEKYIQEIQDDFVKMYLGAGYDVIVDNTHFHKKWESHWFNIASDFDVEFSIKDFTDIPFNVCVQRDMARANSVGKKVIMGMYNKYLKKTPVYKAPEPGKMNAILCDIDGTLAHMTDRSPYDGSRVGEDVVDEPVKQILEDYEALGNHIILVSGRDSKYRDVTEKWLYDNGVEFDALFMRAAGDNRCDAIVKEELYLEHIEPNYNIKFCLDDRDRVVDMWRRIGIKCLQVERGDF